MRKGLVHAFTLTLIVFCSRSAFAQQPGAVSFNRDVRPILSNTCFKCHGPAEKDREGELRLDVGTDVFQVRDGEQVVKPRDLAASKLWARINSDDPDERMPPDDSNEKLTPDEIQTIKRWIEQGADWEEHWAFIPPVKPEVPKVQKQPWVRNPIDSFILAGQAAKGLQPSPEASREILLRRVTLDLTGLPPSIKELDAFLKDTSPNAYEKAVDRLLASPQYGERMALMWLDAARYGDSSVYHADGPRDMWAWRDWVIRAYNSNMPFDRFTIEQLAGDLIPNATVQQKVASGFHRNHGTTDEGGVIAE
ncbi:MAG: DUF1549 domain-containing protein, partial [Planctomycetales bacterium]